MTEYLSLPVPRSPMTCQMSVISAQDLGNTGVRMTGLPSRVEQLRAVLVVDRHMAAEPGRVVAAAREAPCCGHPVAALDDSRLAGPGAPGEDAARPAKHLLCRGRVEIGGSHRAAGALVQAPRRAGVALGDLFDDPNVRGGQKLGAAQRARQQHAKKPALDHRRDDRLRQFALPLDIGCGGGELGNEGARPLEVFGAPIIASCRRPHSLAPRSYRSRHPLA